MKTTTLKPTDITRKWHHVDLDGQILGRAAVKIAGLLSGKGKVLTGSHLDNGDFVVVTNSDKIKVTGNKMSEKMYYSHSGYAGGFRELNLSQMMTRDSRKVIEKAVKGMLAKDKHQQTRLRRMKVFTDSTHPYANELGQNKTKQ